MTTGSEHLLATDGLAAIPDVLARLEGLRCPRVADAGCRTGASTLAIARALLDAHVDGVDADCGCVARARARAFAAGLDGRVRFVCGHVGVLAEHGPYDLVLLRDLTDPAGVLRAARSALKPGGTALVLERRLPIGEIAARVGYGRVQQLPVDHDLFHLHRLDP
jgi:2-polyprenyl-3-methyl-5-hydroxy-6-metoxy-1,4-benzoquinol methylase